VFEAYLKRALAPSLKPGQAVVMDDLSSRKGSRVRELIEQRGCSRILAPELEHSGVPDYSREVSWRWHAL
jgi:hypothetical protein